MEHIYTIDTKMLQGKLHYFVKKIMVLPEFKGLADIVIGYGMHTSFEKACSIADIHDDATRQLLLFKLEAMNKPLAPVKHLKVEITESVNHWLISRGAEVLN
jgi:hypothetical protein